MRFAMVTTFYPPHSYGGDATYVRALARSLVRLGHEVDVIASSDAFLVRSPRPFDPLVEADDGVRVHRLTHRWPMVAPLLSQQTGHPALYKAQLAGHLARDYDVLHFHNISLVGGPAILSMGNARTRLYTLHEHWLLCPTHIFWKNRIKACDRRTCFTCSIRSGLPPQLWRYTNLRDRHLASVDRLLAPSEYTAERHRRLGVSRPIDVLPLFSSIDSPDQAAAAPPQTPTILFVGRVTASKGVAELARAVSAQPDIQLKVIGEGDLRRPLAATYAAQRNIQFLGHVDQPQLIEHYRQATALVFPSIAPETFGLAIVEAAACGTPAIVAAAAGGAAEIVAKTGGGLLYSDEPSLIGAIRRLATDASFRDSLRVLARDGYETFYTQERHIAGYLSIVEEALAKKGSECAR